jgi:hypothetical protein
VSPHIENGWLIVDCDAPDTASVELALGRGDFVPAFRDYDSGKRVAKARLVEGRGRTRVMVRVNGKVFEAGVISL